MISLLELSRKWSKHINTNIYVALVIFMLIVLMLRVCDIHNETFEDGSGRITYCMPFALCSKQIVKP